MKKPLLALTALVVAAQSLAVACGEDAASGPDGTGTAGEDASTDASASDGSTHDAADAQDGGTDTGLDGAAESGTDASGPIQTVFVIMMSTHSLSEVEGSASAPYYNGTLLKAGARASNYKTPPGNHPDEPNYIWLEAGDNLAISSQGLPADQHQATTDHLVTQLKNANITWKAYAEDMTDGTCPIVDSANALYRPKHTPMVFFDDVVGNPPSASNAYCIAHVRPYSELANDLANNTVARFAFITPNLCHDGLGTGSTNFTCNSFNTDLVKAGDDWLAANVPAILASQAYLDRGALFIIWDQGGVADGGVGLLDGPLPFVVLSPKAKANYTGTMAYTHSSSLRTFEAIFGLPFLRGAAVGNDLSDLFTSFP